MDLKALKNLDSATRVKLWKMKSIRGEVCGIYGCGNPPSVKCEHCGCHYCDEHKFVLNLITHQST